MQIREYEWLGIAGKIAKLGMIHRIYVLLKHKQESSIQFI